MAMLDFLCRRGSRLMIPLIALALATSPVPALAQASVPDSFSDQLMAVGLDQPCGIAFVPGGRVLVVEQLSAKIKLYTGPALSPVVTVGTVANVNTSGAGERGLLGIAVDPNWPAKPYIYIHCTSNSNGNFLRICRYTCVGDVAGGGNGVFTIDPNSRYDLIDDVTDNAYNHNGGTVRFGRDGMLYVSMGEDADWCMAQDPTTLHGVILRLDVSGLPPGAGNATRAQITPSDNPFVGATSENQRLVWAYGLRNPFRFQIDRSSGYLYVADVGLAAYEELDRLDVGGLNFRWPFYEGPRATGFTCSQQAQGTMTAPIFSYDRESGYPNGAAIIAAAVYRAPVFGASNPFPPEYDGDVFASDYYNGYMWRLKGSGNSWDIAPPVGGQPTADHWGEGFEHVADYLIGPDGALWYCKQNDGGFNDNSGEIRRVLGPSQQVVVPGPPPALSALSGFYPLPSRSSVRIDFTLSREATVEVSIHDLTGRRVRRLMTPQRLVGDAFAEWDGLDDDHRVVDSGLYFARIVVDGDLSERRIVLVR